MANERVEKQHEQIVEAYFRHIRDLRTGKTGSVEALLNLWDADGTFEFAGSPPVTGTFQGRNAIHTLYKNRFHSNRMPLKLEGTGKKPAPMQETALGVVDTEVHRIKVMDEKIVAGWITKIGTQDERGFQVAGSHTFTFKNGKISSLKVVVSPRPEAAPHLNLEGLTVDDIGRLSLAAWPVVV
ncbi:nuclear transport factor 2 family protein [Candidatus Methylomirabilis sp.]|uniref:nuclear transport factor 2 family protein n=1 Tax=Candidatus Methylomirabilis sp. TaxID=2032687 RepID=UPI002A6138B0|nr:nuclear transport factor 2 family protein [Candidatus Methylomirabilis sp.]